MEQRLTSPSPTTYAKDGALFMASESTKDQENQPRDPIETPLTVSNIMDIPAKTTEQRQAKAAWSQVYGGKMPLDREERRGLEQDIKDGKMPDATRPQQGAQDPEKQRRRGEEEDDEEEETPVTPDQQEKPKKKEGKRKYPEDAGPQIDYLNLTEEQAQAALDSWRTRMLVNIQQEMRSPDLKNDRWIKDMNDRFNLLRLYPAIGDDITKASSIENEYIEMRSDIDAEKKAIDYLEAQGIPANQQTREQREWAKDQIQEATSINARMDRIKDQIRRSKNVDQSRNLFERLRNYVREIAESEKVGTLKLTNSTHNTIQEIMNLKKEDLDSLEKIKAHTDSIMSDATGAFNIKKFFIETGAGKRQSRGGRIQIRSLEELVELVAESQGGEFQPGGEFEIMNERGEIQLQNLMAWIRRRILDAHEADPDSAINTFNRIAVPTFFRSISLDEMLFTPTYFQKRKIVITGSEGENNLTMVQESVDDDQYERVKYSLLYEAWLFGVSHTNNAEYRAVRGQEEPLFNKIAQLYSQNHFTKDRNRFLNIFSLTKIDRDELEKVSNKEEQGSVGRAIQRGVLAYYHLWELAAENPIKRDRHGQPIKDKDGKTVPDTSQGDFTKIEGNNFYKTLGEDGVVYFYHSMVHQLLADKGKNEIDFKESLKQLTANITRGENEENLTDLELAFRHKRTEFTEFLSKHLGIEPEDVTNYESNPRKFAEVVLGKVWGFKHSDLNIFDDVNKEQRIITLVNKAVSSAIGRKEGLGKLDTEYAGEWAFTMRDWTGIAARNDTQGIGFDAWSKLINFQDYRGRQGRGRSGAGNMYNFPGFKRLGVTLLDGLLVREDGVERKDDKKKSLITVLEESNRNNTRLKTFDFDGEAMKQFSANHINNAFKVFQFILEKMETKMSSVVSIDKSGRPVFNHEAALQIMDGLWHDLRYAFDQPRFNYDLTEIEGWENRVVYDAKGKPVFDDQGVMVTERVKVTQSMRKHMFGEELIDLGHKVSHRPIVYGKDGDKWARQMGRSAFAYLVAKEIFAHRQWDSGYVKWPVEQIELIQAFFHHQALEFGQKGEHDFDMKIFAEFFDHHEWNEILKLAKSSYRRMYGEEYALQGTTLIGGLIGKTIGETIKQVSTIAK